MSGVWWPSKRGMFHYVIMPTGRGWQHSACGVGVYRPQYELRALRRCGRCLAYTDALTKRATHTDTEG